MRFASSGGNDAISRNVPTWRSGITSRCVSACGLMSRIATKPSPLRTCSPSRYSRQKRHSSGGNETLLRHRGRACPDDAADIAAEEPGRVVVAVAASRAVDEDGVVLAELRAPALQRLLVRECPQARTALLLDRR